MLSIYRKFIGDEKWSSAYARTSSGVNAHHMPGSPPPSFFSPPTSWNPPKSPAEPAKERTWATIYSRVRATISVFFVIGHWRWGPTSSGPLLSFGKLFLPTCHRAIFDRRTLTHHVPCECSHQIASAEVPGIVISEISWVHILEISSVVTADLHFTSEE